MRILVIASQKGGSGKSTLSAHLSVEALRQNLGNVTIVDTDNPQGSLSQWWNVREAVTPQFATVEIDNISDYVKVLDEHAVDLLIIDTPPAITETIRATIAIADLVVIPVRPSPNDMRSVGGTIDVAEDAGKPFVFIINGATPRTNIANDTARALAQHGKVAPVTIHNRVDFATSMITGQTAGELNEKSRSADEIAQLWTYVNEQMMKYGDK